MSRRIVERREIPLPPLPPGSESSLRVVDLLHDDGSVKRLWSKDDGVQVLGLTTDSRVVAITEHGYTHLVGGYVESNESPAAAARRELREESGYDAHVLELLTAVYQDSGGSDRAIWLFLATGCRPFGDSEASISVTLMSPNEFWQLITEYVTADPYTKHRGLMSLITATLAFSKLGWLTVTPTEKEKVH